MNVDFNKLSQSVMDYTVQQGRSEVTQRVYRQCYETLGDYLAKKEVDYSSEEAAKWLSSVQVCERNHRLYHAAVNKLNSLFYYGEIQSYNYDPAKTIAGKLCPEFQGLIKEIKAHISERAGDTICRHAWQCAAILLRFQKTGICTAVNISYDAVLDEFFSSKEKTYYSRSVHHTSLKLLLQFLYEKGDAPFGFTLFVDAMAAKTGCFWNNVPEERLTVLRSSQPEEALALDQFLELRNTLHKSHARENYSKTALNGIIRITDLFYLFMDMNGLRYYPEVGCAWLESVKPALDVIEYKHFRRIICLLEKQYEKAEIPLNSSFVFKDTLYKRLPDWCRPEVDAFLQMKKDEGWAASTLQMYQSCICRFCISINGMGIRSFNELTPLHVKQFNLNDQHNTPEGKNAYNSRIRKFLQYLGENRITDNPFLFLALPSVCTTRETLVITLTEQEQSDLRDIFHGDDAIVGLREKAMIQLGLYMGIRETDIVSLSIDDIDWENAVIRVLQNKTSYEVDLPMPVPVANAIYRYIMKERPEMPSRSIFIRKRAPFSQVGTGACWNALNKALPGRNVPGSGFHVTRKTYATNLIRNDTPAQYVAEALGQRGLDTVHKYISLEEKGMRLCGLSLHDRGLLMEGGFCHE